MNDGVFFYANDGSRRASAEFKNVVSAFESRGIEFAEAKLCSSHDELNLLVKQRIDESAKIVIVGGGDGTLGSVSEHFLRSETVFGAFPLGTGNQFAHEVGIPCEIGAATECLLSGRVAAIDLGMCNDQGFLTVATMGLTTDIARGLTAKGIFGKASYGPAFVKAIRDIHSFQVEIVGFTETIVGEMIQVVVCNGRTHAGPFLASPDATITDGMFDVYSLQPMGFGEMVGTGVLALAGKHTEVKEVDWMKSSTLRITTKPKIPVVLDGEEIWFDELDFRVEPGGLRAIVGPDLRVPQERLSSVNFG
ncbi:MAG: diacylglycerol/lipid kinase family protein [Fimbriimonadaceae bacterium]